MAIPTISCTCCSAATPRKRHGGNVAKWCYKPFNDLIIEAEHLTDIAKRTELYKQAQVIFKEEAPWFTIAHAVQFAGAQGVMDFKLSPFGRHAFYGVDLTQ